MAQPPSSTDDIIEPFRQVHLKPQWNKGPPEIAFPGFKIDTEKAVFGMRVANNIVNVSIRVKILESPQS